MRSRRRRVGKRERKENPKWPKVGSLEPPPPSLPPSLVPPPQPTHHLARANFSLLLVQNRGFNPAGSGPQAQVPFLQPGTGGAGGSPVCQRGAGPGQTRPYTPSFTNTREKSLGWGALVQIIENFGEVISECSMGPNEMLLTVIGFS